MITMSIKPKLTDAEYKKAELMAEKSVLDRIFLDARITMTPIEVVAIRNRIITITTILK